jgi:hypothetical protein
MQTNIEHYKNRSLETLTEYVEGIGLVIEEWKDVEGYEGMYRCSSFGRIKSLKNVTPCKNGKVRKGGEFIMKLVKGANQYLVVTFHKNGEQRTFRVHRLIGLHFIDNEFKKPTINHKKGIKTDNRMWELEWSTESEQAIHKHYVLGRPSTYAGKIRWSKGKVSHKAMGVYCPTLGLDFTSILHASKETGVSKTEIGKVCHGKRISVLGLNFRFL